MTTWYRAGAGLAMAAAALTLGLVAPAQAQPAAKTVAGTWNMTLMSHQVGLELTQDGTAVTGTLMMMGKDVTVEGTFVDGALTLVGIGARVADREGGTPVEMKLTGRLTADDTLEGEVTSPRGPATWTAERLGQ
jgi:hypothetical protein